MSKKQKLSKRLDCSKKFELMRKEDLVGIATLSFKYWYKTLITAAKDRVQKKGRVRKN